MGKSLVSTKTRKAPTSKRLPSRLEKILDFLKEAEKMKMIERTVDSLDGKRVESNAEHVWEICMFLFLMGDSFPGDVDTLKMLKMALVHDLVEIYAGDTYFLDAAGRATKRQRENESKERLFSILPDDLSRDLDALFEEYESKATTEAQIVNAIDKLQPIFQIINTGGQRFVAHRVNYNDQDKNKRKHMEPNRDLMIIYEYLMSKLKSYYETVAPDLLTSPGDSSAD